MHNGSGQILSISRFAERHGYSVDAVMSWIVSRNLKPPILVTDGRGEKKINETLWNEEFGIQRNGKKGKR